MPKINEVMPIDEYDEAICIYCQKRRKCKTYDETLNCRRIIETIIIECDEYVDEERENENEKAPS